MLDSSKKRNEGKENWKAASRYTLLVDFGSG